MKKTGLISEKTGEFSGTNFFNSFFAATEGSMIKNQVNLFS